MSGKSRDINVSSGTQCLLFALHRARLGLGGGQVVKASTFISCVVCWVSPRWVLRVVLPVWLGALVRGSQRDGRSPRSCCCDWCGGSVGQSGCGCVGWGWYSGSSAVVLSCSCSSVSDDPLSELVVVGSSPQKCHGLGSCGL